MPRPRTGQLVLRGGIWHARITVTRNGQSSREWYTLDTADRATAERRKEKLMRELAAGAPIEEACSRAGAPDTVAAYATSLGDRLSVDDRSNLRIHVLPLLGPMALIDVRLAHCKSVRDKVLASKARRGRRGGHAPVELEHKVRRRTVSHVLGAMKRLFAAAIEDELIEQNPAGDVKLPKLRGADREITKPRMILTDEEIAQFLAHEAVDLELKMLSIVARCEGGMRTSDLHAWEWTMLDLESFAWCAIPRSKTAAPETLDVPPMLRPFLRSWWERAGRPSTGPVFPVRHGERAGERKAPTNSYAKRLRRDLARAGVFRLPPIQVPATTRGTRTDLGRTAAGTRPAPNPHDPLYFESATSMPVDFHSFRRAFNTALAAAGVNVQKAMKLAGHSNAATHMRYVMQAPEMRAIPDAALPRLPAVPIRAQSGRGTANHRRSKGGAERGDDDASSGKHSVFIEQNPVPKPKVASPILAGGANDLAGFTQPGVEFLADRMLDALEEQ
jgi:integrase